MQKILWVIICVLLVGYVIAAIVCGQCAGGSSSGINDTQYTIDQLRQSNTRLETNNRELGESVDRLEKLLAERDRQFKMLIADLTGGVGEAEGFIRDALESVRRLEKIHSRIGN